MKIIAIIPARGGSKGVPGKNKKHVDGKPLICYSIETALQSKQLAGIWVSSDDPEILQLAGSFPGILLHQREEAIAGDNSPVAETVNAIIRQSGCDAIMLLQPTAPIRTSENIDEAIRLLDTNKQINSVISVVAMNDIHPARMYWKENGQLISILPEFELVRRQEIPPAYYRNGSIYLVRREAFEKEQSLMVKPTLPYEMPLNWLLNIDEPRDMIIAEALIPAWKKGLL